MWVDLRSSPSEPDLCSSLPRVYPSLRIKRIGEIIPAIRDWLPWAVCFEYDRPDSTGLEALAEIKGRHSSLPVIMLTERHTRRLASWALRCCVWDYLVKPLSVRKLCNSLASIDQNVVTGHAAITREAPTKAPIDSAPSRNAKATHLEPAVLYVEANFPEKLRLATAARLCHLSPFQFSRNFKKETGVTFRDFVVRRRINHAAQLMKQSQTSVTEAAFVVGFNDLSYFARMFRKQYGISPSRFRAESEPSQLLLFPAAEVRKP